MLIKLYKQISILVLVFLLVGFAKNNSPEENVKNKFLSMQKNYFLKLDLRAPSPELKTIPAFSAELDALADEQRSILATNKNVTTEEKELAGLIFIYDAMLNSNIIIGISNGKLSFADFAKSFSKIGAGATKLAALEARSKYDIAELKSAASLRPNDHRIDSWIVGAKSLDELIRTGRVSNATQKAIIKAIGARPSFNLWTAILVLHNEDPAANQALLKAAIAFVDAAKEGKDPCKLHPQDCASNWKAPYNFQASVTELGDVFLQQAAYSLKNNDIEKAMTMAGYASGTYSQLETPKHSEQTNNWPDKSALTIRKNQLTDIQHRIIPKEPLRKMSDYQRVYECASCHGRV